MLIGFKEFILESSEEGVWTRAGLASDPESSPEQLTQLAQDPDAKVRFLVAQNTSTPAEVLTLLSNDNKPPIARAARKNPNFINPIVHMLDGF